jgi:hypothetical protein
MVAITNYFMNAEKAVDVGCQGA